MRVAQSLLKRESLGTRFGDPPDYVHELVHCHPNARTLDRDGRLGLGKNDFDEDIRWGSIFSGSEIASRSASASIAVITQAFIVII